MSGSRRICAVLVATVLAMSASAYAQNQTPPAEPASAPEISAELIERVLGGDTEAFTEIRSFLVADTEGGRDAIVQRATQLISQIGAQKSGVDTESLLRVIDRLASEAISLVAGSQVVRVGIEPDFVPSRAVVALDFGPPDGTVSAGFERVSPGDPRVGGSTLDGLRRPSDSDILNDGITGIERIEVDVPDGEYRVILMTQNLGDRQQMANPFGSEIVINGAAQSVADPDPDNWLPDAVFSNGGGNTLASEAESGPPGFLSGELELSDPTLIQRQQGGAVIVNAVVRNGKLTIELGGIQGGGSYLTGLIVEPAEEVSELVMSNEAVQALTPPDLRNTLEEEILASAAEVLADITPAEGDPELVELPEPVLDPQELASTSS